MRFIDEIRWTIITAGTSFPSFISDEAVTEQEKREARFNLTGEDIPLDKCPRTIHLERNSWPFFAPRDRPSSKGSPFGSVVFSCSSPVFASNAADIVSISAQDVASFGAFVI